MEPNKKRNPVAKQLRHFTSKIIKNKKIYDRKNIANRVSDGTLPRV